MTSWKSFQLDSPSENFEDYSKRIVSLMKVTRKRKFPLVEVR